MSDDRLWITDGDLDLVEYVFQRIDEVGTPADVDLMVLAAGVKHVQRLASAMATGVIGNLRLIIDAGTLLVRDQAKDESKRSDAQGIEDAIGIERVRAIRVHAKAGRIVGPNGAHSWICSANLNRNSRHEQYETTDIFGPILGDVFGAVFDRVPPGCAAHSASGAYKGLGDVLEELKGSSVSVYRPGIAMPTHMLADMEDDQILFVERAGVGDLLPGLLDLAGVCRVRACTWGVSRSDVHVLTVGLVDGRISDLAVWLPGRFGRRSSMADGYCAVMGLMPDHVRWSPSHAKILVIRGEDQTFVVTGSANFGNIGQLNIIRIRRGDEALADLADGILDELRLEEPPKQPSLLQMQEARSRFERDTKRSAPAAHFDEDAPLSKREREMFEAACAELGISPKKLPPGLGPRDIIDSMKSAPADDRKPGRPRKSDRAIQWTAIHDLLVYGEEYVDDTGVKRWRYPGYAEVGRRYGVTGQTVSKYAKKHDIESRRAEVKREEDAIVHQHIIHERAADRAALHEKVDAIAHLIADRYLEGLQAPRSAPNHIRVDSINDVRQAVELAQKLGAAANGEDSDEVRLTLSIEGLRDRHRAVSERRQVSAAAALGLVEDSQDVIDVVPIGKSRQEPEPDPVRSVRPSDPQVSRLGAVDEDEDPWEE